MGNKKVLQIKKGREWDRATREDLDRYMSMYDPFVGRVGIRATVRHALFLGKHFGFSVRFDYLWRCRERSYKPFTQTQEYFRGVEEDAELEGIISC